MSAPVTTAAALLAGGWLAPSQCRAAWPRIWLSSNDRPLAAADRGGFAIVASGLQQCLAAGDGVDSVDVTKMEKLVLSLA